MSLGVQGEARDNQVVADRLKRTASVSPLQQLHRPGDAIAHQSPERPFTIKTYLHTLTGGGMCFPANPLPARAVERPEATRRTSPDGSIRTLGKAAHGSG